MPLYKVEDTETKDAPARLVKASSKSRAVSHVAHDRYRATTMENPTDVAELMATGVKLETAGEAVETTEPAQEGGEGQPKGAAEGEQKS
jgi:hypothetical protein